MTEFLISFAIMLILAGAIFGWIIGIWLVVTHLNDKRKQRRINAELDDWVRRYNAYNAGVSADADARERALNNIAEIIEAGMKRTPLQRKRELGKVVGRITGGDGPKAA